MCWQRLWKHPAVSANAAHGTVVFLLLLLYIKAGGCTNETPVLAAVAAGSHDGAGHMNSVKKDLKAEATEVPLKNAAQPDGAAQQPVVVISERTLAQMQAAAKAEHKPVAVNEAAATTASVSQSTLNAANGQVQIEESGYKQTPYFIDADISETYKTGFYFFFGLSCAGIALIMFKIYRMRLTRAERKYGVQGDRTTQELTPLPISIEEGNSDEEDQTLFEINRQQIRIL